MSQVIIKGIKTSFDRVIDLKCKISRSGLIKEITFANKNDSILESEKILEIILPEKYNNKPIKGIGKEIFENPKNQYPINKLVIPNNYTIIESSAFSRANIKKVIWSSSVEVIPPYCFDMSNIKSIENIDNIIRIDNYAFNFCCNLKEFAIPENVTSIGYGAFRGTAIKKISWNSNINYIPESCFSFSNLKEIKNIEHIERIGQYAFSNCEYLKQFDIPQKVTTIEKGAFSHTSIKRIRWPDSINNIPAMCFDGSKLESIENIDNITEINEFAFRNCRNLKEITLPNNIKTIGDGAFKESVIKHIRWPSNTKFIPKECFAYSSIKKVENIKNVERIGEKAFQFCTGLYQFDIPNTVSTVGKYAFSHSAIKKCKWSSLSKTIPEECFSNSSLQQIINIEHITNIKSQAFSGTKFTEFTWPENCHTIPEGCFAQSSLKVINVEPSTRVLNIKNFAFKGTEITELDLSALAGCKNEDSSINVKFPYYN